MINAKSTIKLNMAKIRELTQAQVKALELTAEELHTEVGQAQVVPRDTGNLQGESMFLDCSDSKAGKVTVVHNTPYARKLYFHPEYKFRTDENPNARGEWFKDWEPGGKKSDFATNTYKKIYRRLTGV